MFIDLKNRIIQTYYSIRNSIGTYPALIALGLSVLAGILLQLESPQFTEEFKKGAGFLIVNNADTARSLLNTLIGGIISLTVFSFSMVMILLNQASSNYSPRLLPGLISNKQHQFVLGFYIGSILFNIICLINILPDNDGAQLPGLTILIGILLGPVCLALFVFFIHSISQAIQIDNILQRLYKETALSLDHLSEKMEANEPSEDILEETAKWFPINSKKYGQLISISEADLTEFARQQDVEIMLVIPRGVAILEGDVLLLSSRELEEEARDRALQYLHFGNQEIISENFVFGFKQLTEILLKAMSPGINDPGTAMDALDYLTSLITKRMQLGDYLSLLDKEDNPRAYLKIVAFEDLVYFCFSAIRTYIAHDPVMAQKMLSAIKHLRSKDRLKPAYLKILEREQEALRIDIQNKIENPHDLKRIQAYFR